MHGPDEPTTLLRTSGLTPIHHIYGTSITPCHSRPSDSWPHPTFPTVSCLLPTRLALGCLEKACFHPTPRPDSLPPQRFSPPALNSQTKLRATF